MLAWKGRFGHPVSMDLTTDVRDVILRDGSTLRLRPPTAADAPATTLADVCDVDLPEALDILPRTTLADTVLDRVIPLDLLVDEGIRPLVDRTARGTIVVEPRSS